MKGQTKNNKKTNTNMTPLSIVLPKKLWRLIELEAQANGDSVESVIAAILTDAYTIPGNDQ
jgi:ABC-type metal ion transport system substrate-binding protein